MRVLIIENDALLQRSLDRLLRRWFKNADIWTADNGQLAINSLDEQFDLIISDYDLNGPLTGGDVLSWIRKRRPDLVERFVFLSGNPIVETLHSRVLLKPVFMAELHQELCRAIQP